MENKLTEIFDNLSIEQTERLLDDNMEIRLKGKDRFRIKNSVFEKIGSRKKKRIYIPRQLAACVAALAIIFISLSIVGFDNAFASIKNLFTFIPGVGIVENAEAAVYTIDPILRRTVQQGNTANIVKAVYSNGFLNVSTEVRRDNIQAHDFDETRREKIQADYVDFSLFVNGEPRDYRDESSPHMLVWSEGSAMLDFSYKTDAPASDDVYEIAISGFDERLSFRMIPCADYEDIKQIGPTEIQNGISITTTAQRIEDKLIVWLYPFRVLNHTNDSIIHYGLSANGAFNIERFIEMGNGKVYENRSGLIISERLIFDMPESGQKATLHIPYLSMYRAESGRLRANLPNGYATVEGNASVKTTLGTILVKEITREACGNDSTKDIVRLYFDIESNDENMRLYSFGFTHTGFESVINFDPEKGQIEYLEIRVNKDDRRVSLNITGLYYYLFGEYVIPLDMDEPPFETKSE